MTGDGDLTIDDTVKSEVKHWWQFLKLTARIFEGCLFSLSANKHM